MFVSGEIEPRKYPTKKRQNTEYIQTPPAKKPNEPLTSKNQSQVRRSIDEVKPHLHGGGSILSWATEEN